MNPCEKLFESFSKYFVCITEKSFAIQFPITFKFVPTPTASPTTTKPAETQVECQPGQHQITAFACNDCPAGNNCKDPKNPVICQGRDQPCGSAYAIFYNF